jgi:hypothetical protein
MGTMGRASKTFINRWIEEDRAHTAAAVLTIEISSHIEITFLTLPRSFFFLVVLNELVKTFGKKSNL